MAVLSEELEEEISVTLSEPQAILMETRANRVLDMAGQGGGKSQNIGYHSGFLITNFPRARGFIGANTYDQLSGATLKNCFEVWRKVYGMTEYNKIENPMGAFVYDRKPPPHFQQFIKLKSYKNVMCFWNGAMVILGSLENYQAQDGKEFAWAHLDETKDTKEEAVKEVITGRLRQRGLWVTPEGELIFEMESPAGRRLGFKTDLTNDEAQGMGWLAYNPLLIHTSPASGLVVWLNDWFDLDRFRAKIKTEVLKKEHGFYHKENPDARTCVVIYSAYHNKENLPLGKLEEQEKSLGEERALKLVYGYPFAKSGGEYFTDYSRLLHVGNVPFLPELRSVVLGWDFNVVPYLTCLKVQFKYITRYIDDHNIKYEEVQPGYKAIEVLQVRVFGEYCFESPRNTTEAIGEQFKADHPKGSVDVTYYGDSQGTNRIEGLNKTRYDFVDDALWEYLHNDSNQVVNPNVSPYKRRDLMNDIFGGRIIYVEIIIDESCEKTIEDMEQCKLGPKGKVKTRVVDEDTKESYEPYGHTSDALEYIVSEVAKHLMK